MKIFLPQGGRTLISGERVQLNTGLRGHTDPNTVFKVKIMLMLLMVMTMMIMMTMISHRSGLICFACPLMQKSMQIHASAYRYIDISLSVSIIIIIVCIIMAMPN